MLSDRLRPYSEAAPWVIDEVKRMEAELSRLRGATSPPDPHPHTTPSLFCVTTYSIFRHRYLVEAPTASAATAYVQEAVDSQSDDLREWQQTHLDENVMDVRRYTHDDAAQAHVNSHDTNAWIPLDGVINTLPTPRRT